MIIRFILIAVVLYVVFRLLKNVRRQPVEKQKKAYFNLFLWCVVGLLVIGFLTGRMHWIGAVAAGMIGLAKLGFRFFPVLSLLGVKTGLAKPTFSSPTLRCTLNLQPLALSGEVLSGEFKGKTLDELQSEEVDTLLEYTQINDKKAYYLLTFYQQLHQHTDHTEHQHHQTHFDDITSPNIQEAEQILGLTQGYSKDDIVKAHKKLIQKLHPDRGGNDYLASRVNLAKSLLLDNLKNR